MFLHQTPWFRGLQETDALEEILSSLEVERKMKACPLYLKISPETMKHMFLQLLILLKSTLTGTFATIPQSCNEKEMEAFQDFVRSQETS